jgi:hypothetical protein
MGLLLYLTFVDLGPDVQGDNEPGVDGRALA